jgi:hypothetical protein
MEDIVLDREIVDNKIIVINENEIIMFFIYSSNPYIRSSYNNKNYISLYHELINSYNNKNTMIY